MNYSLIVVSVVLAACVAVSAQGESRISGSGVKEAKSGQFPWQVRLLYYKLGKPVYCTGVLIDKHWVLTVANCLKEKIIIVQANSTASVTLSEYAVKVVSDNNTKHPGYHVDKNIVLNDIGLIHLPAAIPLSEHVKVIPLPNKDNVIGGGEKAVVPGWGRTPDPQTAVLQYATVATITNEQCKKFFYQQSIVDGALCTNGLSSPCYGDGGSGLVQYVGDKPLLVGIVSFVPKNNCFHGGPAGYMRVSYYRDWIKEVTGI